VTGRGAVSRRHLRVPADRRYTSAINTLLIVTLACLLCAAAAGIILLSIRARTVSRALERARRDCGENETRLREMSELGRKQEEQLEHSTRLAELGEMAAAISHELNQPLTGIRNYARNAFYMIEKKAGTEEDVKGNLRLISEQVDRAARIINQMRELTRRSDNAFAALEVNGVLRECLEFLVPQMKLAEVELSLSLAVELPPVWGDRIRLSQVFINLLTNARQAMDGSSTRRLIVASRRGDAQELPVVIEISDTGKGFSDDQARKLFQPFYTTRKGGHGLGLSISRAIIQDHKGVIEAFGTPGTGATFRIRLPAAGYGSPAARQDGSSS